MPLREYLYHVLDFETTDLPSSDAAEVAEIALLTCNGIHIVDIYHQFYSIRAISDGAAKTNGLSIAQLSNWPSFWELSERQKVVDMIKYPIFAHQSSFERHFLLKYGIISKDHPMINTIDCAKGEKYRPENNKLVSWLAYKNIAHRPHGALSDAFGLFRLITRCNWYPEELDRVNLIRR